MIFADASALMAIMGQEKGAPARGRACQRLFGSSFVNVLALLAS